MAYPAERGLEIAEEGMVVLAFALLMLIASALLVGLTLTLGVWMHSASSVVFPSAGLVVATPMVFLVLLIAEAAVVVLAAWLVRYVALGGMLSLIGRA